VLTLQKFRAFVRRCEGQDLVEYGLLIGMISTVLVASIAQIGPKVSQPFAAVAAAGDPANGNPGNGNPGNGNPGSGNPGNSNPGNGNPGNSNPGNGNPGNSNPGRGN
jgi:Flp pilus assembly pilin Flp